MSPNLSGQSLGRYHILEQLGEGGMAIVYKAYDTRLEAEVAVKVIRTENILPSVLERALKRFEREAKALAQLTHPNIVKVTDYGEYEGKPYLVMPYLPGGTLKSKLTGTPMPWQAAAHILIPIADALGYAHRHEIIHRDVKPSNILITENGQPMLADFGVAKLLDAVETMELTGTGVGIGTPEYMAPEQATNKLVDARADIYALGVVLFEMVTGRKPYTADTPMAVLIMHSRDPLPRPKNFAPNLPQEVENILLKALAKNPADRYQQMGEFAKAMDDLTTKLGTEPSAKWLSKLPGWPWRVAAVLAGMAMVAGVIGYTLKDNPPPGGVVSTPTAMSTAATSVPNTIIAPTATSVPETAIIPAQPTDVGAAWTLPANFVYDDFSGEGFLNPALWNNGCGSSAIQMNGVLTLGVEQLTGSCSVIPAKLSNISIQELGAFEVQLRISKDFHGTGQAAISILDRSFDAPGNHWWAECGLVASPDGVRVDYNVQNFGQHKTDSSSSLPAAFDTWYTIRLETDPKTMAFSCYVDGKLIKTVIPSDAEALRSAHFQREIQSWRGTGAKDDPSAAQATTHVDNVRIFPGGTDLSAIRGQPTPQPSDPTLYDDFSNPAYDGKFDQSRWVINFADEAAQQNGALVLKQKGKENQALRLELAKYANRSLSKPMFFQADLSVSAEAHAGAVTIMVETSRPEDRPYMQEVHCGLNATSGASLANLFCFDRWNMGSATFEDTYNIPSRYVDFGSWHTVRVEIDPATMTFTYYLDGERAGAHTLARAEILKNVASYIFLIEVHTPSAEEFIGYVDNVRVGAFAP